MVYALVSDIHAHNHTVFSSTNPDGVNSRLRIVLDELERAANVLRKAGGDLMVCAGDIFHTRGAIDPEVLNPVQDTIKVILDMGIKILAIPGNHDLKSVNSNRLSSAVETLAQTRSEEGTFVVYNESSYWSDGEHNLVFVPWIEDHAKLLAEIESMAKFVKDPSQFDLIIHAGIAGVIPGLNRPGDLTDEKLGAFGFRYVFAGHYHNHKALKHNVVSIGATTHHNWGDVSARAGFLLVDDKGFHYNDTHAPKFVDLTGMDEAEMRLEAPGNYVRFRGPPMTGEQLEELRKWLSTLGAKGVQLDVPKATTTARTTASATGKTLKQSVQDYVLAKKDLPPGVDREALQKRAAETLERAYETHEEA